MCTEVVKDKSFKNEVMKEREMIQYFKEEQNRFFLKNKTLVLVTL